MNRLAIFAAMALGMFLLLTINITFVAPATAVAFAPTTLVADLKADACGGVNEVVDGGAKCGSSSGVTSLASTIVNVLSFVVGVVAVIMIIVSGFRFMTSGGDSSKVASARTALVYALIGIAIAALAQVLVKFVLNSTNNAIGLLTVLRGLA
jgi:hypothetical protein